jgi:6-pyruvoyltetrahydropterin/6-carboxytetrahydropterin synthase
MMKLGMEFSIDYSHRLEGHPTCGRDHGHTAKVIVEVRGRLGEGQGYRAHMLLDYSELKEKVRQVLARLDHRNLNELFEYPTSENICRWIFEELSKSLDVVRVTFYEGYGKWCTVEKE